VKKLLSTVVLFVVACAAVSLLRAQPVLAAEETKPVVENAWLRSPPPGGEVTAAYFTVRNPGSTALVVRGVESPVAMHAMLHETTVVDGQSRMRERERLEIPPNGTLTLEPGGLHVMLHGLRRPLAVGERVPLVLLLEDGGRIEITAEVRPLGAR